MVNIHQILGRARGGHTAQKLHQKLRALIPHDLNGLPPVLLDPRQRQIYHQPIANLQCTQKVRRCQAGPGLLAG